MIRMPHIGFVLAFGLALGAATQAHAQSAGTAQGFHPMFKNKQPTTDSTEPPPALPGAASTIAPAEKTQLDLPPTESLFDAINRGDIASARDAISRGADLNGRNVLGMTPLDLSVDLSRNDITFLLLSLRGADSPPASATAAAAQKPAAKVAAAPAAAPKPATKPAAVAAAKPVLPPSPRQYAGPTDPGTPNPQAGFLGFGGSVQ